MWMREGEAVASEMFEVVVVSYLWRLSVALTKESSVGSHFTDGPKRLSVSGRRSQGLD